MVKTFSDVTEAMLACMQSNGTAAGTRYDPPGGNQGTATTKVPVFGTVVITYDLNPATGVIAYEIQEKPHAVPESMIWARIEKAVAECRSATP